MKCVCVCVCACAHASTCVHTHLCIQLNRGQSFIDSQILETERLVTNEQLTDTNMSLTENIPHQMIQELDCLYHSLIK
jgi:hypothetical protein